MISIVTATYNQLGVNKLFLKSLRKYSAFKNELIIVDNLSTDGTREFFRKNADVIIENDGNYFYSHTQNQGAKVAKHEYIAFLNNDLIVPTNWDKNAIRIMEENDIEVMSFASTDHLLTQKQTKNTLKRWRFVKYPVKFFFGLSYLSVKLMTILFYGNWSWYCRKWEAKHKGQIVSGISGSCVIIKKSAFDKIGMWDETMGAPDWDLMFKTIHRNKTHGDIKPIKIAYEIYMHHFQRLTIKQKYPPYKDGYKLRGLGDKWSQEQINSYSSYNFS